MLPQQSLSKLKRATYRTGLRRRMLVGPSTRWETFMGSAINTPVARAVEQGQDRRPEGAVQGQGHLGISECGSKWRIACASSRCSTWASIASFEVAISSSPQGARCLPRRRCGQPRGSHAAKRLSAQFSSRSRLRPGEAVQRWIKQAGLRSDGFLPKSHASSPHLGTRQYARILEGWEELGLTLPGLRDSSDAKDQGDADLSADQEPARRATVARALQAGVDGPVPRHRG